MNKPTINKQFTSKKSDAFASSHISGRLPPSGISYRGERSKVSASEDINGMLEAIGNV